MEDLKVGDVVYHGGDIYSRNLVVTQLIKGEGQKIGVCFFEQQSDLMVLRVFSAGALFKQAEESSSYECLSTVDEKQLIGKPIYLKGSKRKLTLLEVSASGVVSAVYLSKSDMNEYSVKLPKKCFCVEKENKEFFEGFYKES